MKKITLSLVTIVSLGVSSLSAYDYQIKQGSQMLGAVVDIKDMTQFKKACVDTVYHTYFPNGVAVHKIYNVNTTYTGYEELNNINKGQGFILDANQDCTVTITDPIIKFKDAEYEMIKSPTTGEIWLDRNLGAQNICTKNRSEFDSDSEYEASQEGCFGDYYQWGREADGHQLKTSPTTTNLRYKRTAYSNYFVLNTDSSTYYDWLDKGLDNNGNKRKASWESIDGSSICPEGFKVPSMEDLEKEAVNLENFTNILKFPLNGVRTYYTDDIYGQGIYGSVWTVESSNTYYPDSFTINENSTNALTGVNRASGRAVRCIKN